MKRAGFEFAVIGFTVAILLGLSHVIAILTTADQRIGWATGAAILGTFGAFALWFDE